MPIVALKVKSRSRLTYILHNYRMVFLIYDFIRFEIHLPAVVAVDGVSVFNVVVTIVLVVGVIPVIAVIKVHIELNYCLRNQFRIFMISN